MYIVYIALSACYDVLYRLIRELRIPADSIFYPEKPQDELLIDEISNILSDCSGSSLMMIKGVAESVRGYKPEVKPDTHAETAK